MAVILPPQGAFLVVTTDGTGVATGFKWVKVRDDAQHPPESPTENDLVPKSAVSRGENYIYYSGEN